MKTLCGIIWMYCVVSTILICIIKYKMDELYREYTNKVAPFYYETNEILSRQIGLRLIMIITAIGITRWQIPVGVCYVIVINSLLGDALIKSQYADAKKTIRSFETNRDL